MNHTHFAHLGNYNLTSNKLTTAVLAYVETLDGSLLNDASAFTESLKKEISKLNNANPRCTPVEVSKYSLGRNQGHGISLSANNWSATLYLYKVKNNL